MASPQLQRSQQAQDEPLVAAPLSCKRPSLASPSKKRARSEEDASASPTSEVDPVAPEERAISPKKKVRAEADPAKWEGLSSSVDLDEAAPKETSDKQDEQSQSQYEPTAFEDAPVQLTDDELRILQFFMGA